MFLRYKAGHICDWPLLPTSIVTPTLSLCTVLADRNSEDGRRCGYHAKPFSSGRLGGYMLATCSHPNGFGMVTFACCVRMSSVYLQG